MGVLPFEYEGPYELLDAIVEKISNINLSINLEGLSQKKKNKVTPSKRNDGNNKKQNDSKKNPPKKAQSAKISAEKFDIYGNDDGVPKLKEFFDSKQPGASNAEKIVVIGYYITELMGEEKFTDGQIEFAFKMLKLKRPTHLRQIITNAKNDKDWFDKIEDSLDWQLTRGGEIFVSDDLPKIDEKQSDG